MIPVAARPVSVLLSGILLGACQLPADDPLQAFERGDYTRSYHLWQARAQESGDAVAQNYLGIQDYLGLGRERDPEAALQWFSLAARQGEPAAQRNLGSMYYAGETVQRDFYTAFLWFFAAAQQGNRSAERQLRVLSGGGKLSPNQQRQAMFAANEFIPDPGSRVIVREDPIDQGLERFVH